MFSPELGSTITTLHAAAENARKNRDLFPVAFLKEVKIFFQGQPQTRQKFRRGEHIAQASSREGRSYNLALYQNSVKKACPKRLPAWVSMVKTYSPGFQYS